MRATAAFIDDVAPTAAPVLITGETGTGKELAARCLHARSPRRARLFVPLNCAALPAELLEAELFGHARGAFTGADREREGKFAVADGGTLFLDEIGDMPPALQATLLRVLEDGVVEPLGANRRVRVDVRIVAATNQPLQEAIAARRFRSDLYFRVNTFELHLPPLRERPEDVAVLAPLFLDRFARELGKPPAHLSDDALELLRAYPWPGNVRELRNLMERAAVLAAGAELDAARFRATIHALPGARRDAAPPPDEAPAEAPAGSLQEAVDQAERRTILQSLADTHDNKAEAARRLGVSERTLWYKLRKHGL
jgi:two-component system response regulator AtoC